jgi:5'-3' exonuclease
VKRPPRYKDKVDCKKSETLIVDGNALLNVAYHGAKNLYNSDGNHIGGIYQFFTILRKIILDQEPNKLFIFWDGKLNGTTQPQGTYVFTIEYLIAGKKIHKTGALTLIH